MKVRKIFKNKTGIMGVINVSPESFYKQSIRLSAREIAKAALQMEEHGADIIDIGAMSTAPYLKTMISEEREVERLVLAIKSVRDACSIPISVDTLRASVADVALSLDASMVNDVTGLKYDPEMANVIADHGAAAMVCAYEKNTVHGDAVKTAISALRKGVKIAVDAGIRSGSIIVDPAIGFFRDKGRNPFFTRMRGNWYERDLTIIRKLDALRVLRKPICVSVSRKSFIGRVLGIDDPEERLPASLAAEAVCVLNGANIIRTHNVSATLQAVRMAESLR
jgi:dihydropteroate synthase